MNAMTNMEAQWHIDACREALEEIDETTGLDIKLAKMIGNLVVAIDQLATVVEDLISREQGKVIQ